MKRLVFVTFLFIAASFNGYSQTKQELIKELFKVMHQDSVIDKSFSAMIPALLKQVQSEEKDSLAKANSQERIKATMPIMKDIVKRMVDEDMVVIYDKYFTESEIKDFIAFYKSPSGQKFVKTTPAIQADLMAVMFQKYMPEFRKASKAKMDEMKANEKKAQ